MPRPEETETKKNESKNKAPEDLGGQQLVLPFMKDILSREPVDKKSGESDESNGRAY